MMQFLNKTKSVIYLLLAAVLFGQAISYANVTKASIDGPVQVLTAVQNYTHDTAMLPSVNAQVDEQVQFRVFVKNTSGDERLNGVRVRTELDPFLEYVAGSTKLEFHTAQFDDMPDGIVSGGLDLPEFPRHKTAYLYFLAKVKNGASGTLTQISHVTYQNFHATDTTARVVVGGSNEVVPPRMLVDTAVINLGTNPNPSDPSADWRDRVMAEVNDTVGISIEVQNDHPTATNSRLKEVTVKASKNDINGGFRVRGTASADNHEDRINDAFIDTNANILNYVSGSARTYFYDASGTLVSLPLGDAVMSNGVSVGDIDAGRLAKAKYVYFEMRLADRQTSGTIQIEKHLYKNGGWVQNPDPDKQVDFVFTLPSGTELTVRTDNHGSAVMDNLPFGTYTVREIVPVSYELVELTPSQFTLDEGNLVQQVVAQNKQLIVTDDKGNLTIVKFIDTDGDGVQDANEGPQAGVTFTVSGPNNYSVTRVTNADGHIELTDLALGAYTATETVPLGYTVTTANPQNSEVIANQTRTLAFGNKPIVVTPKGNLQIIKFEDKNANRVQDAGEPFMADVVFTVTGPNGYSVTRNTADNGQINLTDLPFGSYEVTEQVPSGFRVTTDNPQTSVVEANDAAVVRFGNQQIPTETHKGSLKIIKFEDKNGNREFDSDEPTMKAIAFKITGPAGFSLTKLTDDHGVILLENLALGTYTATENVPEGYRSTTDNPQSGQVTVNVMKVLRFGNQKVVIVTPTPTPTSPKLQLTKYVGNASRNEATDKTATNASAGQTVSWRLLVKSLGDVTLKQLKLEDTLPANVKLVGDIVITRDGQKAKLLGLTRDAVLIGDLAKGQEVTIEFQTVISADVACHNELTNNAAAYADNHDRVYSQAKVLTECVIADPAQQALVPTGANEALLSLVLSGLSVMGYTYTRQRKTLDKLIARF